MKLYKDFDHSVAKRKKEDSFNESNRRSILFECRVSSDWRPIWMKIHLQRSRRFHALGKYFDWFRLFIRAVFFVWLLLICSAKGSTTAAYKFYLFWLHCIESSLPFHGVVCCLPFHCSFHVQGRYARARYNIQKFRITLIVRHLYLEDTLKLKCKLDFDKSLTHKSHKMRGCTTKFDCNTLFVRM